MTDTKFIKRKRPKYVRMIILLVILVLVMFLFYSIETILSGLFTIQE